MRVKPHRGNGNGGFVSFTHACVTLAKMDRLLGRQLCRLPRRVRASVTSTEAYSDGQNAPCCIVQNEASEPVTTSRFAIGSALLPVAGALGGSFCDHFRIVTTSAGGGA